MAATVDRFVAATASGALEHVGILRRFASGALVGIVRRRASGALEHVGIVRRFASGVGLLSVRIPSVELVGLVRRRAAVVELLPVGRFAFVLTAIRWWRLTFVLAVVGRLGRLALVWLVQRASPVGERSRPLTGRAATGESRSRTTR